MSDGKVIIELSQEEAVVLYEALEAIDEGDFVKRDSDKKAIWNLICDIEKQSTQILNNPNYEQYLETARRMLIDGE